jgi:diguanylate cyclase (GGDEF)-like protein/PAS domain S-box-containing protein
VEFTPSAGYGSAGSWLSWGAFASGVAISGLIAMYLLTVVRFEAKRRAYLTESNTALAAEVAERRQVEAALRRSEGQYRAVVEQVQEVIFQSDAGGRWTFLNPAWADITGFSIEESLGLTALEFVQSDDARQMAEQFEAVVHGTQDSFRMEVRHLTKNGGIRWLDVYACALRDEAGTLTGLSGTLADVTERKEFEARLAHQAYHDALTDLPNRAGFTSRLGAALERAEMSRSTVALLMLDLDGFKEINDTYGHPAGDVLLVEVGRRLRASVAEADFVARLGGDEFTIILERPDEVVDAQGVPTRVLAALSSPVMWNGHDLAVSASIGIAESTPGERPERDELVRRADVALYEAKAAGKGRAIPFRHAETLAPLRRSA